MTEQHSHGPLLATLLDLDAEIHSEALTEAMSVVSALVTDPRGVRRVLDVGAGTGTGSIALARRFPAARVVAVDVDERMLERVRDNARAAGLGDRVEALRADVTTAPPGLGVADLVWCASALHEVADPDRAFRTLFEALRPGGVLAVVEMDGPPAVLPLAHADLEERVRSAAGSSADHPDWTSTITAHGFEAPRTRRLTTDVTLPADGPAGEYAALELRRVGHAAPALRDSDRATLMTLAGDGAGNVRTLGEVRIRGTRTLWTARRP
ncbi:class I SAM-dependent methyltransferase [Umezawaea sp.]|uniref:class I SAM-dependent methyltransferase n=1 Tax=Umezawaea sp. TaxID=1955258 RepID=UPI002ED1830A